MRTILNILNFILGGFATTLGWLLATLVSIILIVTLPLTRSCWEITRLSLFPYGNEAIHVDELEPGRKNGLLNAGGTVLNILWFIFFGWWLCLMHIFSGIAHHRHPGGDREFQNRRHRPLAGGSPGRFCGNRACCA